jgi:hypothetical protein
VKAAKKSEAAESFENGTDERSKFSNDTLVPASSFLFGIAKLLRESVQRFESISGGITEAVMSRPGMADRELVVTLQAFDRLQQEFIAVADILARYSGSMQALPHTETQIPVDGETFAAIAMSDVKERLLNHLQRARTGSLEAPPDGEEIF